MLGTHEAACAAAWRQGCLAGIWVAQASVSSELTASRVIYCCQGAQQNKVDDVQFTRDVIT
jgi:hypothetical protein